ncbi:MAG: acyltransferase [archaeon]|nr:acyltransferase [archaeon]
MAETPVTPKGNARLVTLDITKGIIMVIIVFGHLLFLNVDLTGGGGGGNDVPTAPSVLQAFLTGLMVFFVISGYFYRPHHGYVKNVKKRVIALFLSSALCFIVLPLVMALYLVVFGQAVDLSNYPDDVLLLFGELLFQPLTANEPLPFNFSIHLGYYYLQAITCGFIIFYAVADWALKSTRNMVVSIAVFLMLQMAIVDLLDMHLPFMLHLAPITTAFMLFGAFLGREKVVEKFEAGLYRTKENIVLTVASTAAMFLVAYIFPPDAVYRYCIFGYYGGVSVLSYSLIALLLMPLILNVFFCIGRLEIPRRILTAIGRHTLAILLFHSMLIKMILAPFYTIPYGNWFPPISFVQSLIVGCLAIFFAVVIASYGPKLIKRLIHRA